MRLTLAFSALTIIFIDPSEPNRLVALTYAALVVYVIYSAVIFLSSVYRRALLPNSVTPWVDVGCYLVFVALSSGTSSIFFYFFFFPILVASFREGFASGFRVAIASSVLFTVIGYATAPGGGEFELNRFLLRPVYLLVLGYMMAYWGGREIKHKQRLGFLREITGLSNPRFGVSYTIGSMLQKLQTFYDADSCLLVLVDPVYNNTRLFRLGRDQAAESVRSERIPENLERLLLSLPDGLAVIHRGRPRLRLFSDSDEYVFDLTTKQECTAEWRAVIDSLATKLELGPFVSVPLSYRGKTIGRLYLMARQGIFGDSDVSFLIQVVEQMMPVIHNIRLLARLALNAADQERQRLARDLHDSVIQPYIGLQYKLAAIRNKSAEGIDTSEDLERLLDTTVNEVHGLRGFVRGLREGDEPGATFMSAVQRFAAQFAESYDLDVEVESRGQVELNDRLAAELIRIVHEGLSNIRKHTEASFSKITVERSETTLRLSIENNNSQANGGACPAFVPRSITERTEELGGRVNVEQSLDGRTVVKVEIPL
ncbi:MAG TPA: histidine kinase [Pyrinomonadaceae bacterium]|nr:histidine kinase [Pyrinomonadaceae bacterium]